MVSFISFDISYDIKVLQDDKEVDEVTLLKGTKKRVTVKVHVKKRGEAPKSMETQISVFVGDRCVKNVGIRTNSLCGKTTYAHPVKECNVRIPVTIDSTQIPRTTHLKALINHIVIERGHYKTYKIKEYSIPVIVTKGADITYRIEPRKAKPNEEVRITVRLNPYIDGDFRVEAEVAGKTLSKELIGVRKGQRKKIIFKVKAPQEVGRKDVKIRVYAKGD